VLQSHSSIHNPLTTDFLTQGSYIAAF